MKEYLVKIYSDLGSDSLECYYDVTKLLKAVNQHTKDGLTYNIYECVCIVDNSKEN